LLAWWWSRGLGAVWRGIALAFLIFTVLATLGTGEHYLVDLVVALPFAVMVQGAATVKARTGTLARSGPVLLGLAGVLSWFALLRFAPRVAWISSVLPWLFILLTVYVFLIVERRYCRFASANQSALPPSSSLSATAD
jgi:hypothetical protein